MLTFLALTIPPLLKRFRACANCKLDCWPPPRGKLDGVISVGANTAVTGNNTNFNSQLKPGDSISFNNDAGTTITRVVKAVVNNESLVLESASSGTTTNATAKPRIT